MNKGLARSLGVGAVVACVLGPTGTGASPSAQRARPTVVELLDRYAAHDFEAPVSFATATSNDADKIADELAAKGTAWTSARGARETPGRRLVAATFALDVVRIWSANPTNPRWTPSRRLLAWGCNELRRNSVWLEGERWWHLAAVALYEGRPDAASLIGEYAPPPISYGRPLDGPQGHLAHARARFPDEPRFRLADVVAREQATSNLAWSAHTDARARTGALPPEISQQYITGLTEAARPVKSSQRVNPSAARRVKEQVQQIDVLRETQRLAEALFDVETIAGEAHLRYAYATLQLGDRARGLEHLTQAEGLLADPVLLHVARVFAGSAHERLNQPSEAIAAYRRALELAPSARTASLPLTSLLMRESRVAEASDVAGQLLLNPQAADPLSQYRRGDYRFVLKYLEQLKAVLP